MHLLPSIRISAVLLSCAGSAALAGAPAFAGQQDAALPLDEIIVSADYRERSVADFPASVTILDARQVEGLATQHFEELIDAIPNMNWSGDGHRARYLQIRGVGELEQYQGAPNPSVGFLIDDIDFSGIGGIATLFDLQQIEVMRGPQGSRYGANALAGLVYMQSRAPTPHWDGQLTLGLGGDDTWSAGAAFGGPIKGEQLTFRLSAHRQRGNGFRHNPHLGRDDSNGRDETTIRGRLRLRPAAPWQADLSLLLADIDNGYDAFALDNGYRVLSDRPGRDAQRSVGAALRLEFDAFEAARLVSITSIANSDIDFDFDADWGNSDSWAPFVYDFVSQSDRIRETISQELRLHAGHWLLGAYALRLREDFRSRNRGEYTDPFFDFSSSLNDTLKSDFTATNVAVFGQYEHALGEQSTLTVGLRGERRASDYVDTSGLQSAPDESMWGGELSLQHQLRPGLGVYATMSRGYKAGGFNLGPVPDGRREFGAEALHNVELGLRSQPGHGALQLNLAAFVTRRDRQQVRTSEQLIPGDPASFVFFTDNIARGKSRGFEAEARWQAAERWRLSAAVGLLDARFSGGREQAHAPDYTAAVSAAYRHPRGFFASLDLRSLDEFYFDVSHDQQSEAYWLANARLGFETAHWSLTIWARNLFDQRYAVRGFYFGNEPPDFPATLYTRLGDPRQLGVRFDRYFQP